MFELRNELGGWPTDRLIEPDSFRKFQVNDRVDGMDYQVCGLCVRVLTHLLIRLLGLLGEVVSRYSDGYTANRDAFFHRWYGTFARWRRVYSNPCSRRQ